MQLIIRRRVLGGDIRKVTKDLLAVNSQRGEQDQLLPCRAEEAGIVFDGEFAEERQLLDPSNLPEKQFIRQTTEQRKQLCLRHFIPAGTVNTKALKQLATLNESSDEASQVNGAVNTGTSRPPHHHQPLQHKPEPCVQVGTDGPKGQPGTGWAAVLGSFLHDAVHSPVLNEHWRAERLQVLR